MEINKIINDIFKIVLNIILIQLQYPVPFRYLQMTLPQSVYYTVRIFHSKLEVQVHCVPCKFRVPIFW